MEASDKRKLRANYVQLVRNIHPEDVTDYLYQERVLNEEDIERITAEPVRAQKARILLSILPLRRKDALSKLLVALKENGYCELADEIEGTEDIYESEYDYQNGTGDLHRNVTELKEKLVEQAEFVRAIQNELEGKGRDGDDRSTEMVMIQDLQKEKSQKQRLVKELCTVAKHEFRSHGHDIDRVDRDSTEDLSASTSNIHEADTSTTSQHQAAAEMTNLKCLVVGDGASGKTCLTYRHIHKKFLQGYIPTVFDKYTTRTTVVIDDVSTEVQVSLWDTAGQEAYDRVRLLTYPESDVVLILYSTTSYSTLDNVLCKWLPEIRHHLREIPCILVGTKADSAAMEEAKAEQCAVVKSQEADNVADRKKFAGKRAFMTSALTGQGVDELMDFMVQVGLQYRRVRRVKGDRKQCSIM